MKVHIKENSFLAWLASLKFNNKPTAIVWGKTIHLYKISVVDFIGNEPWLKHELKHIEQYKRFGTFRFLSLYIWESFKNGYTNNKYEIEARSAEESPMSEWCNYKII